MHPNLLTESELDRILQTIPNFRDKMRMMVHLSVTRGWNLSKDLSPDEAEAALAVVKDTRTAKRSESATKAKPAKRVEPGPHDIEWQARDQTWLLKRYPDPKGCSWELFDGQGLRISEGRTTSGKDERARKDNARKQARRVFEKITR